MWLPGTDQLVLVDLWVAVAAALLGLANMLLGMYSFLTGKDHWPQALHRLRRRAPASDEDRRMHGLAMMLTSAGILLILLGVGMTTAGIGSAGPREPGNTLRFVLDMIAIAVSLACVVASYRIQRSINYIDIRSVAPETRGRG